MTIYLLSFVIPLLTGALIYAVAYRHGLRHGERKGPTWNTVHVHPGANPSDARLEWLPR